MTNNRFTKRTALSGFGLELYDDLSIPMSEREQARFKALFYEHELIMVRNQELTLDQQMAIQDTIYPVPHTSQTMGAVSTEPGKGILGRHELVFHNDGAFLKQIPPVLSLLAIDVKDDETSTIWCSLSLAAADLPLELRSQCKDRKVQMVIDTKLLEQHDPEADFPDWLPETQWDVLMQHPQTGRELVCVSSLQSWQFSDLTLSASRKLRQKLLASIQHSSHLFEHHWRNGDFIIWDNISTHHSRGALNNVSTRTLQRTFGLPGGNIQALDPRFEDTRVVNYLKMQIENNA